MKPSFIASQMTDIPVILEMMKEFYALDNYPFDVAVAKENLMEFIGNADLGRLFLILEDKNIIGYITLTFGYSFEYGGRDAFIDEFFIKEAYRNQGVGKATMAFLAEASQGLGVKALHLEVERYNEHASRLYLNEGFKANNRTLLTKRIALN
ncbi:MAG: GNAT family N-acetyltransferase [Cyclobacteriaceae bacterium]